MMIIYSWRPFSLVEGFRVGRSKTSPCLLRFGDHSIPTDAQLTTEFGHPKTGRLIQADKSLFFVHAPTLRSSEASRASRLGLISSSSFVLRRRDPAFAFGQD